MQNCGLQCLTARCPHIGVFVHVWQGLRTGFHPVPLTHPSQDYTTWTVGQQDLQFARSGQMLVDVRTSFSPKHAALPVSNTYDVITYDSYMQPNTAGTRSCTRPKGRRSWPLFPDLCVFLNCREWNSLVSWSESKAGSWKILPVHAFV